MDAHLFASAFGLVFIAELPDKTAFASLVMAAQAKPLPVLLGACAALAAQSAIAVLAGRLFALLPAPIVHIAAGLTFLVLGVLMWRRKQEEDTEAQAAARGRQSFFKAAGKAFVVIFLAEWGDLTQLATATLAAQYGSPATIFAAATLALWTVTGLAVTLGHWAKKAIQPHLLQKVAAFIFAGVGLFLLVQPLVR